MFPQQGLLNFLISSFLTYIDWGAAGEGEAVGGVENGSWAPSAGRVMREMIEAMKDCQIVEPMVTIRSRMKPADEAQLALLAEAVLS